MKTLNEIIGSLSEEQLERVANVFAWQFAKVFLYGGICVWVGLAIAQALIKALF